MNQATVPFINRIALAFDFDETLAPSTYPKVLQYCGFDPDSAGIPLALRQGDEGRAWAHSEESFGDRRVENVAPTDYTDGGEALKSILLAVDSIASKIALRSATAER